MRIKAIMIAALVCFGAQAGKTNIVDVLILNPNVSKISTADIKEKMKTDLEFGNRLLNKGELSLYRVTGDVKIMQTNADFSNLREEMTGVISNLYSLEGFKFNNEVTLLNSNLAKKVSDWVKKDKENYKVIYIPRRGYNMDCGITYFDAEYQFSILYADTVGYCSKNWILAHELGHQEGMVHENLSDDLAGGVCGKKMSLMHSGMQGRRDFIMGDPDVCKVAKNKVTPHSYYKALSDEKAKYPSKNRTILKPPVEPVILSEIVEAMGEQTVLKLTVYNPHPRGFRGRVTFTNVNAPTSINNAVLKPKKLIYVGAKAIGRYEIVVKNEDISAYGGHLKVLASIEWK